VRNEPHRVDAYLAALAPEQRDALSRLRATVRAGAPDAHEGIAYGMPAFYSGTRFLVSYAAFKRHLSLFPASNGVLEQLPEPLRENFAGKGTIQFTVEKPLPDEVLREIVRIRLAEVADSAQDET
jgi:uncharacterized protein YdhG (YjbR/CyaY superfamily)